MVCSLRIEEWERIFQKISIDKKKNNIYTIFDREMLIFILRRTP